MTLSGVRGFVAGCMLLLTVQSYADQPTIINAPVKWNIETDSYANMGYAYAPFFVQPNGTIKFYTVGGGVQAGNGVHELMSDMTGNIGMSRRTIIETGPDPVELNYFRGLRVAKDGQTAWMMIEVSRCYSGGCDLTGAIKRLAMYRSKNDGISWSYQGLVRVDGVELEGDWMAHTGLVFNAQGDDNLNLDEPSKNKFVTIGTNQVIYVSNDGVNYVSVKIQTPFPKDRMVFASLAKTPYGFHIMTGADWSDATGVTIIRHLFSKDLITWHAIESQSILKNKNFYKGVHLSFDALSGRLWAFSPCGSNNACGILAWLIPQDFVH